MCDDRSGRHACRRAFTLVELLVVIGIVALLLIILLPALRDARRTSRAAVCRSNLKQLGTADATYSIDFRGAIFSFSWSSRNLPSDYPDLVTTAGIFATDAAARQATDIIRRHSPSQPNFTLPTGWIPAVDYTHLVLLDYLAARLPEPMVACPEDRPLLLWQSDIAAFNRGDFGTEQPVFTGPGGQVFRAKPYSSSYETTPASYDSSPVNGRVQQGANNHYTYGVNSNTRFGGWKVEDVAFPSLKVHMHDTHQRHRGRPLFFAHPDVIQPVLQFDSAIVDRKTRESGLGWRPTRPLENSYTTINYVPYQYEPRTSTGEPSESFAGRYRWTRGGLKGVDVGPEVTDAR